MNLLNKSTKIKELRTIASVDLENFDYGISEMLKLGFKPYGQLVINNVKGNLQYTQQFIKYKD